MRNQERVWHVPEANRAYVPNIYGTSTLPQARSPAPYYLNSLNKKPWR